jgi:hypothetical protein
MASRVGEAVGNITRRAGSSGTYLSLSDIEHDRRRFLRDEDLSG